MNAKACNIGASFNWPHPDLPDDHKPDATRGCSTCSVSTAIQVRFMVPATNSNAISNQQHPVQVWPRVRLRYRRLRSVPRSWSHFAVPASPVRSRS